MEDKSDNLGCSECVDLLADYVDGALPRDEAERLEWHLAACPPCVAFVKTYKGTVDAAARLRPGDAAARAARPAHRLPPASDEGPAPSALEASQKPPSVAQVCGAAVCLRETSRGRGGQVGLGFDEGAERLRQWRAAPLLVGGQVKGARDREVGDPQAPEQAAPAFLVHRTPRDDGHPDPGLHRLLDGLGRAHLAHHAECAEVEAHVGESALERGPRARAALAEEEGLRSAAPRWRSPRARARGARRGPRPRCRRRHQLAVLDAAVGEPRADHAHLRPAVTHPVDRGLAVADQERDGDVGELRLERVRSRAEGCTRRESCWPRSGARRSSSEKAVHRLAGLARQREQAHGVRESRSRPAGVTAAPRPSRSSSRKPNSCSSARMCSETVGWVRDRASAARENDPSSATFAKISSCLRSTAGEYRGASTL